MPPTLPLPSTGATFAQEQQAEKLLGGGRADGEACHLSVCFPPSHHFSLDRPGWYNYFLLCLLCF